MFMICFFFGEKGIHWVQEAKVHGVFLELLFMRLERPRRACIVHRTSTSRKKTDHNSALSRTLRFAVTPFPFHLAVLLLCLLYPLLHLWFQLSLLICAPKATGSTGSRSTAALPVLASTSFSDRSWRWMRVGRGKCLIVYLKSVDGARCRERKHHSLIREHVLPMIRYSGATDLWVGHDVAVDESAVLYSTRRERMFAHRGWKRP